jgi:hypothetical protein
MNVAISGQKSVAGAMESEPQTQGGKISQSCSGLQFRFLDVLWMQRVCSRSLSSDEPKGGEHEPTVGFSDWIQKLFIMSTEPATGSALYCGNNTAFLFSEAMKLTKKQPQHHDVCVVAVAENWIGGL